MELIREQIKVTTRINILLFGKSGVGKTSFLNYIAGEIVGKVGEGKSSETLQVSTYDLNIIMNEIIIPIRVFDVPGLYDTRGTPDVKTLNQIQLAMLENSGTGQLDAVLMIESIEDSRIHLETSLQKLKLMFGNDVTKSVVVVATKGENLHQNGDATQFNFDVLLNRDKHHPKRHYWGQFFAKDSFYDFYDSNKLVFPPVCWSNDIEWLCQYIGKPGYIEALKQEQQYFLSLAIINTIPLRLESSLSLARAIKQASLNYRESTKIELLEPTLILKEDIQTYSAKANQILDQIDLNRILKVATTSVIADLFAGLMTGALSGTAFGPIGLVAGGIAGGAVGFGTAVVLNAAGVAAFAAYKMS